MKTIHLLYYPTNTIYITSCIIRNIYLYCVHSYTQGNKIFGTTTSKERTRSICKRKFRLGYSVTHKNPLNKHGRSMCKQSIWNFFWDLFNIMVYSNVQKNSYLQWHEININFSILNEHIKITIAGISTQIHIDYKFCENITAWVFAVA